MPRFDWTGLTALRRLALASGVLLTGVARAAATDVMAAHPDAPAVEVGWRGSLRAKAGVRIPLVEPAAEQAGWSLALPAFIELHNRAGNTSMVPYQLWRARITLVGGYRWAVGASWLLSASLAAEHESDHTTGPNDFDGPFAVGFVAMNDVALLVSARHLARHPTLVELGNRLHLLTCTASQARCGEQSGLGGDRTWEVSATVTQQLTLDEAGRWVGFASLAGDALVPTPQISPGARLAARLGISFRRATDWWSFSLVMLAGKDVGYDRQLDVLQFGFTLAWSPFS